MRPALILGRPRGDKRCRPSRRARCNCPPDCGRLSAGIRRPAPGLTLKRMRVKESGLFSRDSSRLRNSTEMRSGEWGFWILDFGFWILDFGFWILDFGFWILDFGFWILDFGFWILDFGFWILDFGFWILDFGFWISDFGFWILDFGFWIADLLASIGNL